MMDRALVIAALVALVGCTSTPQWAECEPCDPEVVAMEQARCPAACELAVDPRACELYCIADAAACQGSCADGYSCVTTRQINGSLSRPYCAQQCEVDSDCTDVGAVGALGVVTCGPYCVTPCQDDGDCPGGTQCGPDGVLCLP